MLSGGRPDRLPLMPITMMFAARHARVKYRDYARDYRVLAGAQLRTAETFGFDYVSAISDPGRESGDCGATLKWFDNQPPAIDESSARLESTSDLAGLKMPDPLGGGRMHDRVNGVAELRRLAAKDYFVEGWIEGPCAESADLRGINTLMLDFLDNAG